MESRVGVRVRFFLVLFFCCPFGGQGFMFFSSFIPQVFRQVLLCFVSDYPFPTLHQGGTSRSIQQAVHTCKVVQTILEGMGLYQKNVLYSMYKIILCMYVIRCCAPRDR